MKTKDKPTLWLWLVLVGLGPIRRAAFKPPTGLRQAY
jgi:hypothetical protein